MARTNPELIESGEAFDRAGLVHRVAPVEGEGPHPTVLLIHGRSGTEDVMWIFARAIPADWLLVAPRAVKEDPRGGYSWRIREAGEWPTLDQFDEPVAALSDFIQTLPELYDADLNRLYLMGFSQGAALSFAYALRRPQEVQAVASLVGFLPVDCDDGDTMAALEGMPVLMIVGKQDPRIPYERSLNCSHTLHLAGADLDYHEYNMEHRLNSEAMRDLKSWWQERAEEA